MFRGLHMVQTGVLRAYGGRLQSMLGQALLERHGELLASRSRPAEG